VNSAAWGVLGSFAPAPGAVVAGVALMSIPFVTYRVGRPPIELPLRRTIFLGAAWLLAWTTLIFLVSSRSIWVLFQPTRAPGLVRAIAGAIIAGFIVGASHAMVTFERSSGRFHETLVIAPAWSFIFVAAFGILLFAPYAGMYFSVHIGELPGQLLGQLLVGAVVGGSAGLAANALLLVKYHAH
jgi:hypothetical protein